MKNLILPKRLNGITPFLVMDVLEKANEMERQGQNIIHLEVGEPGFDTPTCIKEAQYKALKNGSTYYTHSLGLFELRETICKHYYESYNYLLLIRRS